MSGIASLIKQIRSLSYHDMMVVAEELRVRIHELTAQKIEAGALANILSRLQEANMPPSEQTLEEEKVLRDIFRIKRTMAIQKHGNGWNIEVSTLAGSQVIHSELRVAFTMMLDQIITLKVLGAK